jgi:adenylyltransferase/sulfurtransferase
MIALERRALEAPKYLSLLEDPNCGGLCVFEGRVRTYNEGKAVLSLAYECYEPMALRQLARLREEAMRRWGLGHAVLAHRLGDIPIGEAAVWIGVAAAHRAEAFEACRFLIDEVKLRVPIWKREVYLSGGAAWVGCGHEHEGVAART